MAAGISLYATGTSAISFMAIPAKTFFTDWKYYQNTFFNSSQLVWRSRSGSSLLIRRLNPGERLRISRATLQSVSATHRQRDLYSPAGLRPH